MGGKQTSRISMLSLVLAMTAGMSMGDTEYKRERYNVIVDRSPFGADPLTGAAAAQTAKDTAAAMAAAKAAEKELRLCFLLESQSGEIRAGFQNKAAKAGDPKSIMLMVGESFRGMKLLEIDLPNSQATLDRGGTRVTFDLAKAVAAKAAPKPAASSRRFGGGFRQKPTPAPVKPPEPKLSPEEQAKKREEVRENLRQYQMEVIRAGMPPLPIPLTPEMDEQLVTEGILPPE
jgi:hypothetical protein